MPRTEGSKLDLSPFLPQQVIRETHTNAAGEITKVIEYTFGHDEISQNVTPYVNGTPDTNNAETHVFGHDGHGSVRVLYDTVAAIAQVFTYAAYGHSLAIHNGFGEVSSANGLTTLLYSGEQFDQRTAMQYLRARYYIPATGAFNRLDPYSGNRTIPVSLHKYLYAHGDPINASDPSGLFALGVLSAVAGNWGQIQKASADQVKKESATLAIHAFAGASIGAMLQTVIGGRGWTSTGTGAYYGALLGAGFYLAKKRDIETEAATSGILTGITNAVITVAGDVFEITFPDLTLHSDKQPAHLLGLPDLWGFQAPKLSTSTAGAGYQAFFQGFALGVWNEATELLDGNPWTNAAVNAVDTFINDYISQKISGGPYNYGQAAQFTIAAVVTDVIQAIPAMEDWPKPLQQSIATAVTAILIEEIDASLEIIFDLNVFGNRRFAY